MNKKVIATYLWHDIKAFKGIIDLAELAVLRFWSLERVDFFDQALQGAQIGFGSEVSLSKSPVSHRLDRYETVVF